MRFLGIDPGLQITGYGCVEIKPDGGDSTLIDGGVLRLNTKRSLADRLIELFDDLTALLEQHDPEYAAVEKLYSHYAHPTTAIKMGHARGVILLAAQRQGAQLIEIGATEIKKSITGNGHATKLQMQHAIQAQCRLREIPSPPDVADAIAVALCAARRWMQSDVTPVNGGTGHAIRLSGHR